MQGCVRYAFDPCVFDMSQQDAAVAMFESLFLAGKDVIDNLLKKVIVPDKDVAIPHISIDGDALVLGRT